jgi:phthiocerol/phenolphthiocerol synthesis type-I polyketide synthase E
VDDTTLEPTPTPDTPATATGTPNSEARARLIERAKLRRVDRPASVPTAAGAAAPPLRRNASTVSAFYDAVTWSLDATPVGPYALFLNLGYLDGTDDRSPIDLPRNTLDRNSVKLVLEVVGDCVIDGRRVLDAGSGRGGAISTLLQYFEPAMAVGLELSPAATSVSRRAVRDARAAFLVGDAQYLPFATGAFDVVINVESSHCYPDLSRFYAEVRRVLAPKGTFLYSDLLERATLAQQRAILEGLGFRCEVERDITANVLASCDRIAERRRQSFAIEDDPTLRDFLAVPGSPTYEGLRAGGSAYFIWQLRSW